MVPLNEYGEGLRYWLKVKKCGNLTNGRVSPPLEEMGAMEVWRKMICQEMPLSFSKLCSMASLALKHKENTKALNTCGHSYGFQLENSHKCKILQHAERGALNPNLVNFHAWYQKIRRKL